MVVGAARAVSARSRNQLAHPFVRYVEEEGVVFHVLRCVSSTTMLTAATTSPTPRALVQPNRSPKTVAPMATAVRGSSAPKIDVSVGPMNLIALTSVMLEIAVAGSASPRMASLFSVGHEPDTAREHTSAEKQQSSEGHDVKVRVVDSTCAARLLRTPMI